MRRVLIPLAVVCALSLSCSVLVDLDPLRAGRDDAGSPADGGTDAASDSPSDGAADTSPVPFDGGDDSGIGPAVLVPGIPASVALYGVWGTSPSDYWVVGADTVSKLGFVGHWTGSAFVNTSSAAPTPLRSVWGAAIGVLFVGDKDPNSSYPSAIYANGSLTPLTPSAVLANQNLVSVWFDEVTNEYVLQTGVNRVARSPSPYTSAIDISGAQVPVTAGACFAMHARYEACAGGVYAPSAAAPLAGSTGLNLRAIHVVNAAGPILVVAGDSGYLARNSGAAWQTLASNTAENLEGIGSSSIGETVAVGAHGTILTVPGLVSTTVVPVQSPSSENLHAVTIVGQGVSRIFVAVGDKGTVVTRKF